MEKRNKVKKGASLLEVLISLAIFAAAAGPVSVLVMKALSINKEGEYRQEEMLTAQQITEKIKALKEEELCHGGILSSKLDLKVEANRDIDGAFSLQGVKKGYKIEGSIEPLELYKFKENQKQNFPVFDGEAIIEGGKNGAEGDYLIINKIPQGINDKTLKINNKKDELIINQRSIRKNQETQGNIKIVFDENTRGVFCIDIVNDTSMEFSIFAYKDSKSKAEIRFENNGGKVRSYYNLYTEDGGSRSISRVYKIWIKVFDNRGREYEIVSYKSVEK